GSSRSSASSRRASSSSVDRGIASADLAEIELSGGPQLLPLDPQVGIVELGVDPPTYGLVLCQRPQRRLERSGQSPHAEAGCLLLVELPRIALEDRRRRQLGT